MAGDAADAAAPAAADDPSKSPSPDSPPSKSKKRGLLSRLWRAMFGGASDDYEKRLQYLSKEEAAVHARMKRRAHTSRRSIRNLIVFSLVLEVAAVIYAIMMTRSLDLSWQMRAIRVLPMFALPALSSLIYSMLVSYTRMVDRKDQNTLERLRAERKEKIDELKERTNYYTTQQLIQKYDLDPAAKAAAAAVLASKLGADSGLQFHVGDDSSANVNTALSSNTDMVQAEGLRHRRKSDARSNNAGSAVSSQIVGDTSPEHASDAQVVPPGQLIVEHFKGSGSNDGGWIARVAALLVGEDPSQSYALICGNCRMHNGLARKEDFPHITYYCPHCHALNTSGQSAVQISQSGSDTVSPHSPVIEDHDESSSKGSVVTETAAVQKVPTTLRSGEEHDVQAS